MTVEAIVAGHVCIDVIPDLPHSGETFDFRPGTLIQVGPITISTGGCVSNTGVALHRLGVRTRLMGKVGDDPFGRIIQNLLSDAIGEGANALLVVPSEHTSYSVILSPPDEDRMFLHFPGANDTFTEEDVPSCELSHARLFHFGYPPAMKNMYADRGENLAALLRKAKSAGLTTSLDMCYPDPSSASGRANWRQILQTALPVVDVFLPSLEEMRVMLEPTPVRQHAESEPSNPPRTLVEEIVDLGERLVAMGAAIVGIKAGHYGLYLRTSSEQRLRDAGPGLPEDRVAWAGREMWSSPFEVTVVGTTGAGDATVAGFLFGLLSNMAPEATITAACAVGASCVETADATTSIRSWQTTRERMEGGWRRWALLPGAGWTESRQRGVWIGPHDVRSTSSRV